MCECSEKIDAKLKPLNGKIGVGFSLGDNQMTLQKYFIEVEQIETGRGKRKPPKLLASFCPFCGDEIHQTKNANLGKTKS